MTHSPLPYRISLAFGTLLALLALAACGSGDASKSDVAALRQEIAALKQTQAGMQRSIAALQQAAKAPGAPATASAPAPATAAAAPAAAAGRQRPHEAVFRIPTSFSPRKGKKITAVTVVEFGDFQCPFCKAAAGLPDQLLAEFPDDVQFVFKNYPLDRHPEAMQAAKAGWAAHQQGKFWEMYDLIYGGDVQHLSVDVLRGYAKKIGLDMDRFDADMNSQKAQQAIYLDKGLGRTIKLWGTPSYFVNGRRVTDRSPAGIRAMITEEIARIKGPATAGASAGGAKPGGVPGASANGS